MIARSVNRCDSHSVVFALNSGRISSYSSSRFLPRAAWVEKRGSSSRSARSMTSQNGGQSVGRTIVTFNWPSLVSNTPFGMLVRCAEPRSRYCAINRITDSIAPPCIKLASM